MLELVSVFDGTRRSAEVVAALRARRVVPEGATSDDVYRLLEMLLERGSLEPADAPRPGT
jgi:hypothetical protein